MASFTSHLYHYLLLLLVLHQALLCLAAGGSWKLLLQNIGISVMHMQLLPNDRVVMFDGTNFGPSNISLPRDKCRPDSKDCSAHSVEYDIAKNAIRPLTVVTDVWCSSGALTPQGSLVQTGGWSTGTNVVRVYKSCYTCDWKEIHNGLIDGRWYATNHILPDSRQIIVGGRKKFTYEFYPKMSTTENTYSLSFLSETTDRHENNLYPFVFLCPDGNLFIYSNNRAILLEYKKNKVVKTYPTMPGGNPRNNPSAGSAVLLPLKMKDGTVNNIAEILICGGAPTASIYNALKGKYDQALDTCGRIKVFDPKPQWEMETMPVARVMGDMLMLPNGNVLIINGAMNGVAGWQVARNPALRPVIYRSERKMGTRFEVQNPSTIPRMYHSTAILLGDGRVLVGGSNSNPKYTFSIDYPTELRLESYSPDYLDESSSGLRPNIISPRTNVVMQYGKPMIIHFTVPGPVDLKMVSVTMVAPSFNTHSFSMNQRLVVLDSGDSTKAVGKNIFTIGVVAPPSGNITPPGFYLLFVVHKEIPIPGVWVRME